MALGVVELEILPACPIGGFELAGPDVTAKAVRGMEHQLTGYEGGSELRWQVLLIVPALGPSQTPRSRDIRGGWRGCRTRRAGAGHHHEANCDQIPKRQPLAQEEEARRSPDRRLEAHEDAEDLPR